MHNSQLTQYTIGLGDPINRTKMHQKTRDNKMKFTELQSLRLLCYTVNIEEIVSETKHFWNCYNFFSFLSLRIVTKFINSNAFHINTREMCKGAARKQPKTKSNHQLRQTKIRHQESRARNTLFYQQVCQCHWISILLTCTKENTLHLDAQRYPQRPKELLKLPSHFIAQAKSPSNTIKNKLEEWAS